MKRSHEGSNPAFAIGREHPGGSEHCRVCDLRVKVVSSQTGLIVLCPKCQVLAYRRIRKAGLGTAATLPVLQVQSVIEQLRAEVQQPVEKV